MVRPVSGDRSAPRRAVRRAGETNATTALPSAHACHGIDAPTSRICTELSGRKT